MVTVKQYHVRQGEDGGNYISLELTGDVSFVQSQVTGRFYAAAKRCFMYAAIDENTAKNMVGVSMPGSIERVACEPYEYTIADTGEVVSLSYSYQYKPDGMETNELQTPKKAFA